METNSNITVTIRFDARFAAFQMKCRGVYTRDEIHQSIERSYEKIEADGEKLFGKLIDSDDTVSEFQYQYPLDELETRIKNYNSSRDMYGTAEITKE